MIQKDRFSTPQSPFLLITLHIYSSNEGSEAHKSSKGSPSLRKRKQSHQSSHASDTEDDSDSSGNQEKTKKKLELKMAATSKFTGKTNGKTSKHKKKVKSLTDEEEEEEDRSEEVTELESHNDDDPSGSPSQKGKNKQSKERKGKMKGHKDPGRPAADWTIRPVSPTGRTGIFQRYTRGEIVLLQKHARASYKLQLPEPERMAIDALNPAIGEGPRLTAPVLVQRMAEVVYNKRWRLSDLFQFADKDRTWRLDPVKVRKMCNAVWIFNDHYYKI